MEQSDNDLQGSDGSGSLGGPDVRRRIPIKLISKQPLRSKPPPRAPRAGGRGLKSEPGDDENFGFKQEERFDCGVKDVYGSQRRFPPLFWDCKLNLVGEKDKFPIHFCDKCGLPIQLYGRMIPCKHVFCYDCALLHEKKGEKLCPGLALYSCSDPVQRIEQCQRGALWMCSVVPGCKRTYLSERDLQAHVNHRHVRAAKPGGRGDPPPPHPPPDHPDRYSRPPHLPKAHHDPYGQAPPNAAHDQPPPNAAPGPETFRIATVTTRKHSNLITVPIQDDSGGAGPSQPPHHRPGEYPPPSQPPAVSHPHHLLPQQHFGPPPPPPPPIGHPGPAHMVYSQAPPITPPPGHILGQLPPYMNRPPPGPPPQHAGPPPPVNAPPPHHYNPQFPEDQGTLSPPFAQPGGLSPGMWAAPRGPPPPRMQGPPPPQGPHHPDQGRYRPYYQ